MPKPPTLIDFAWNGQLEFVTRSGRSETALDTARLTGLSPVRPSVPPSKAPWRPASRTSLPDAVTLSPHCEPGWWAPGDV